jgi:hypothetical protein
VAVENKRCPECAEDVKADALVCRFCGYRFDRGQSRENYLLRRGGLIATAIVVVALVIVWATGTLDAPLSLYKAGLNAHDCFGSTSGREASVTCGGKAVSECESSNGVTIVSPEFGELGRCFHGVLGK